jgi:hypothetical protein
MNNLKGKNPDEDTDNSSFSQSNKQRGFAYSATEERVF